MQKRSQEQKILTYWKQRLYSKSLWDIFNVRLKNFDKLAEPVLFSIVETFENFLFTFSKAKENWKHKPIFHLRERIRFFFKPRVPYLGRGLLWWGAKGPHLQCKESHSRYICKKKNYALADLEKFCNSWICKLQIRKITNRKKYMVRISQFHKLPHLRQVCKSKKKFKSANLQICDLWIAQQMELAVACSLAVPAQAAARPC